MRFGGRDQQNETCEISISNMSHGLSKLLNLLWIIHFHHNAVNYKAQNEIIGSESEITE